MAEKKFAKGSEEWQLFMDFWMLCQKFWLLEDTDEYWSSLIKETDEFYKKYNSLFAKKLVLSLVDELDSRCKRGGTN